MFHCLLVPVGRFVCDRLVSESRQVGLRCCRPRPFCCYCSVRCSLVSPCLEGWLGDGAWEGCVPEGRVCAIGTPPGTMPSNAPGMPPGATPTTPGGYLEMQRPDISESGFQSLIAHIPNTKAGFCVQSWSKERGKDGLFSITGTFQETYC